MTGRRPMTVIAAQVSVALVSVALVSGAVVSCSSADTAAPEVQDPGAIRVEQVQSALDALVAAGAPAAVVDVRDGESQFSGAAGVVEQGSTDLASAGDAVRIASITKSMVAAVILQMVDEGALTLDRSVDEILPGLLPKPVTVRQLLDHTSGLPNYVPVLVPTDTDALAESADTVYTDDQLIDIALGQPWPLVPGAQFSYSNTGYVVLGKIVQTVDGTSVADSLRTRIFEPAGMDSTEYPTTAAMPTDSLHGYATDGATSVDVTEFDPSFWSSSAAVVSTVGDLDIFFRALFDGTLLPQPSIDQMQAPTPSGYGLGLLLGGDACSADAAVPALVYGQRGNGFGYRTLSFSSPDGDRQVSIAWTAAALDPANDPLEQAASDLLIAGLEATCPE